MKKAILFSSLLLLISGVLLYKFNKNYYLFWNSNSVHVSAESPLLSEKVKIEYGFYTMNRHSDAEIFSKPRNFPIIFDGNSKAEIENKYGENDFLITYNNQYYITFRQFKFNWHHQHTYNFHFYQKNDGIFVKVNIEGPDAKQFERKMMEISKAEQFRCNTPIDSGGYIYNGVELRSPKSVK